MGLIWVNDAYLNDVWERSQGDPFPDERNRFELHPSSSGAKSADGKHYGACTRAAFYDRTLLANPDAKEDPEGEFRMEEGNQFESTMIKRFIKLGLAIRPNGMEGQQRLAQERVTASGYRYWIVGRLDLIYRDENGHPAIMEFKKLTKESRAQSVLGGRWGGPTPDIKHVIQVAPYVEWGRKHGIFNTKICYAACLDKVEGRTFKVDVDNDGRIFVDGGQQPFTMPDIYRQYDALAEFVYLGKEPPRDYDLFYTDEELNELALRNKLTKKVQAQITEFKTALKPYNESPCAYCKFLANCHSPEAASLTATMMGK